MAGAKMSDVQNEAAGNVAHAKESVIPNYFPKSDAEIGSGKKKLAPPTRDSRIFRLNSDKRKGNVYITGTEDVYDPETKKIRRARLLRGAESMWQDQQTNFAKEHVAKNQLSIEFVNGVSVIPIREKLKLRFLELSARNINNPHKEEMPAKDIYYYEWDPIAQSKAGLHEQDLIIKALQLAKDTSVDDMVAHAQYLNVDFHDVMGVPLDEESLRLAYSRMAMAYPKKFIDSLNSPVVKRAHLIRRAIHDGKIDLGKQPNMAYWVDGGFITAVPEDRDSVEFLIEYSMLPGDKNVAFAKQLNDLMES